MRNPCIHPNTWGLVVTGKLTRTATESGLGTALIRLIARGGEPVIRRGVDMALRMMGEQFHRPDHRRGPAEQWPLERGQMC